MPLQTPKISPTMHKAVNKPYTIRFANKLPTSPVKLPTNDFSKSPQPVKSFIIISHKDIKKLLMPVWPTKTAVWSLIHAPVTHIQYIPSIEIAETAKFFMRDSLRLNTSYACSLIFRVSCSTCKATFFSIVAIVVFFIRSTSALALL